MTAASVVGDDFHPDLRTIARLLPRHVVLPSTLKPLRALTALQGVPPPRDVEVGALPSGAGVRVHRPAEQVTPGPGSCGSTAAATCWAARSRTTTCAAASQGHLGRRWPQSTTGWHQNIRSRPPWKTAM